MPQIQYVEKWAKRLSAGHPWWVRSVAGRAQRISPISRRNGQRWQQLHLLLWHHATNICTHCSMGLAYMCCVCVYVGVDAYSILGSVYLNYRQTFLWHQVTLPLSHNAWAVGSGKLAGVINRKGSRAIPDDFTCHPCCPGTTARPGL